jgi:hypothetical protein
VTVCIAAACERGRVVVAATDGAMTYGDISSDNYLPKMLWIGDWLFMYSGQPSNADLFLDDIRLIGETLARENIRSVVHNAFRRRLSRWSSDSILGPFDMDIDEFKREGRSIFGDSHVAAIAKQIDESSQRFYDQVLVVGWGKSPNAVMIHEENREGSTSHAFPGYAAIGSGGQTASSQLLLLKHARHCSLTDTLYSVAAAKFSAEAADGVGRYTTMWISWKRRESDEISATPLGRFVQPDEIDILRTIWMRSGMPKVPYDSFPSLKTILDQMGIDFEHSSISSHKFMQLAIQKSADQP